MKPEIDFRAGGYVTPTWISSHTSSISVTSFLLSFRFMIQKSTSGSSLFLCAVAATLLAACGGSKLLVEDTLDLRTGVTVTRTTEPVIFFRDRSAFAAHARDYVYIGPVEVNSMGQRRYFLWLGAWSTSESSGRATVQDDFETIVVFADGEPLDLQVAGWNPATIGASESVYVKPASSAIDAYYGVTIDQIRVIAEARDLEIRTGPSASDHYLAWESSVSATDGLREFVQVVD